MNKNCEPKVWIAHSTNDKDIASVIAEGLDRQLISVLNDYVQYRLRSGEDEDDIITSSINQADFVLALVTASTNADDMISQIRRAQTLNRKILVIIYGTNDVVSLGFTSIDLAELLSGSPHIYYAAKRAYVDLIACIKGKKADNRQIISSNEEKSKYNVFISKKSEDYFYAKQVYDYISDKGYKTFLSEESLQATGNAEYMKAIDKALEQAEHLIVVGSKPEHFLSGWVEAEWRVFINEKRSGHKKGNIVTMITNGMQPSQLPMSLRYYEVIPFDDHGMDRLLNYLITDDSKQND